MRCLFSLPIPVYQTPPSHFVWELIFHFFYYLFSYFDKLSDVENETKNVYRGNEISLIHEYF